MTNGFVLDASAIIALLRSETGADKVRAALPSAIVSTVNLAEVCSKLTEYAMPREAVESAVAEFVGLAQPFEVNQALHAGVLRSQTRHKGLSLGDRACLALAFITGRTALTADRAWADLDIGVTIELIR